jgi:hypothetical protein
VDYVLIDPPADFFAHGEDTDFSPAAARSETMMKMKTLMRESARILKPGGRVSVITEAVSGPFGLLDFPSDVTGVAKELGMEAVGKVYLPKRADTGRQRIRTDGAKWMASECREMLTFQKK